MSEVVISPSLLNGEVTIPASKSAAHRAIICASLARGKSRISRIGQSADITATIGAMRSLGTEIKIEGNCLIIDGSRTFSTDAASIDCGESGSTLRFLIPVAAAGSTEAIFTGHGRLPMRPLSTMVDLLSNHGITCLPAESGTKNKSLPLKISGRLTAGKYLLPGNISSQYITGLLLSLPLLHEDSEIVLISPLESSGYVDMTTEILARFGVIIEKNNNTYYIKGGSCYRPCDYTVEGDWSQTAFFMSAAALGGSIGIHGLNFGSSQGDRACLSIFSEMGVKTRVNGNTLLAAFGEQKPIIVDVSQIPDLAPALAVTMAYADGRSVIHSAARLRAKESDRLTAIANGLSRMGVKVEESADSLVIYGGKPFPGGYVDGCNDHRILMSFAVGASAAEGTVTISDAQSVDKSYPDFFDVFDRLGGKAHVL